MNKWSICSTLFGDSYFNFKTDTAKNGKTCVALSFVFRPFKETHVVHSLWCSPSIIIHAWCRVCQMQMNNTSLNSPWVFKVFEAQQYVSIVWLKLCQRKCVGIFTFILSLCKTFPPIKSTKTLLRVCQMIYLVFIIITIHVPMVCLAPDYLMSRPNLMAYIEYSHRFKWNFWYLMQALQSRINAQHVHASIHINFFVQVWQGLEVRHFGCRQKLLICFIVRIDSNTAYNKINKFV